MEIKFDTYSFRARVLPVYLTLAPAVLLLAALVPDGLKLPLGGAAAVVFVPGRRRRLAPPASGSTHPVAVGEIEAPTAEASEPGVPAAEETLQAWAAAWSGHRVDEYLSFYSSEFRPPGGMERGAWESQRRTRILRPRRISVSLGTMSSTILEPERVRVVFDQGYRTESYRDEVRKTIELAWEDDRWRIVGERSD